MSLWHGTVSTWAALPFTCPVNLLSGSLTSYSFFHIKDLILFF